MKIAVIGAGNMGGAIVRGLASGTKVSASDIWVADPSTDKLESLRKYNPSLSVTTDNRQAVAVADWVILAVKPWYVGTVIKELNLKEEQVLISIAAGVTFSQLSEYAGGERTLFRMIPNTAISESASMTLVASRNATAEQEKNVLSVFNELGLTMLIPESQMTAAMIITSCGIAYVLKYIHAATEAGVELGISPREAMKMVAQSVEGAAKLILNNDTHPAVEIDKVTTPGGVTIKGLNELDHAGFSSAVIRAMKACLS